MLEVYTASWCSYCKKLKEFLKEKDISYKEVDIDQDIDKAMKLVDLGFETIPQVFDEEGTYRGDCTSFIKDNS